MKESTAPAKEANEKSRGRSKALTVIGIVMCVILVPILIVNVIMIVQGFVNPGQVPNILGYSPMIVLSPSMENTIMTGDLIVIKSVDEAELNKDDIITFYTPKRYRGNNENEVTTHRCIEVVKKDGKTFYYTQGDNNNYDDPWNQDDPITADRVVGKYIFRIPFFGSISYWMQTWQGLVVCIAVPIVLLVGYDLIMKKRYDKKKKNETDALLAELDALRAQAAGGEAPAQADTAQAKLAEAPAQPQPAQKPAEAPAEAKPAEKPAQKPAEAQPAEPKAAPASSDISKYDALIEELTKEDNK